MPVEDHRRQEPRWCIMFHLESPMAHDTNGQVISGIRAYLRTHFPDVEFTARNDDKTHSVILHADRSPRYRLEVTARFLDCHDGIPKSLARLQEWNVAGALRDAKAKLVTLATTGLHTSDPRHYLPRPSRR
jgi:hypothetical protein